MLAYHQSELTRAGQPSQQHATSLGKAVMADNQRKYREALSDDEVRAIESICYFEMQHLGYACEHDKAELDRFAAQALPAFEPADTRARPGCTPTASRPTPRRRSASTSGCSIQPERRPGAVRSSTSRSMRRALLPR